jgi:plastocyanin
MDRKVRGAVTACALAAVCAVPAAAAARTKTVYAGGPAKWAAALQKHYGAGVNNYLINKVTINAGDTVDWNGASLAAGFHSVDIPAKGGQDLPLFVPTTTPPTLVSGVTDANNDLFWFNGKLPIIGFNPALFAPSGGNVYNGSSRIDSGVPGGPTPPPDFKVTFTKPGTYHYFCDVHYGMEGTIVVRAAGRPVPSARRDANVLKAEEQHYVAEAKSTDRTKTHGANVSLGASAPGGLEVFAMFPSTLTVKKGTTVRFSMSKFTRETHTATFGPASYLNNLVNEFAPPTPTPIGLYPSDPASIVLTQTSHGNGFANTGALDQDNGTPQGPSNTITFSQPGTYHYICLIHSFMHGTIIVH